MKQIVRKPGKTRKDVLAGAAASTAHNKAVRAEWRQSADRTAAGFPTHTCNGKRIARCGHLN